LPRCRFPPPWSVEEQAACYVVRDHSGQALTYLYYEDEPGRRSAAKLLAKDAARRIRGEYRQAAEGHLELSTPWRLENKEAVVPCNSLFSKGIS
jgi:hypothetical protein